ncbi:MAG: class I fructose-bisphosphate aldolase [Gemmatimonadaceae bacterium]
MLLARGKGLLAADESTATIAARFRSFAIEPSEENRRRYREMLFTTPGVEKYISGVILFDETIRQRADDGRTFVELLNDRGITPGIKVDRSTTHLAGTRDERITEGLDGLRERLDDYRTLGARFAKWRAVVAIGDGRPSSQALDANAHAIARFAALCQEADIVPIVEPEVLMEGGHSLEKGFDVTVATLVRVFAALGSQGIVLEHMLLKPSMVVPGTASPQQATVSAVASATITCLRQTVPAAVPGIVFLSGGQAPQTATAHLNAMNIASAVQPWELSFSFARALQTPALELWRGKPENVSAAQKAFYHRARCNSAAREGRYNNDVEDGTDNV